MRGECNLGHAPFILTPWAAGQGCPVHRVPRPATGGMQPQPAARRPHPLVVVGQNPRTLGRSIRAMSGSCIRRSSQKKPPGMAACSSNRQEDASGCRWRLVYLPRSPFRRSSAQDPSFRPRHLARRLGREYSVSSSGRHTRGHPGQRPSLLPETAPRSAPHLPRQGGSAACAGFASDPRRKTSRLKTRKFDLTTASLAFYGLQNEPCQMCRIPSPPEKTTAKNILSCHQKMAIQTLFQNHSAITLL